MSDSPPIEPLTFQWEDHLSFKNHTDPDSNHPAQIFMTWDYRNDALDDFMNREIRHSNESHNQKRNWLWVNKLKDFFGWRPGSRLFLQTSSNSDGGVHFIKEDDSAYNRCNFHVEEDGIASYRVYNQYTAPLPSFLFRADSVYNDMVASPTSPADGSSEEEGQQKCPICHEMAYAEDVCMCQHCDRVVCDECMLGCVENENGEVLRDDDGIGNGKHDRCSSCWEATKTM